MAEQKDARIQEKPGTGIDRTLIHRLLMLTPAERVQMMVREARNLATLDTRLRRR